MRFLGLGLHERVPDAKTIWLFREHLTRAGAITDLFATFDAHLKARGYLAMSGQIVDASIIAAPRQRNTEAEKREVKPDLNTAFGQVSGLSHVFRKFRRAWHYAGAVAGALVRSVAAQPPLAAVRLP